MPLEVEFLPWANLKRTLQVGPITFWPFTQAAGEMVTDNFTRDHLARYFTGYVDQCGRPVGSITIASHGKADFRTLTPQERKDVRTAVDSLVFSVIYPQTVAAVTSTNASIGPPSADRYQLMTQLFTPGRDHITVVAGSLSSTGWKMGDITFSRPWSMGGACGYPDEKLLDGLARLLAPGTSSRPRDRLLRCLEWFRLAHTEVDEVSPFSKVVMMATAFEILLDVPNTGRKADWIADKIAKQCSTADSMSDEREIKKKIVRKPRASWWAWDFYKLRNQVVHGDDVQPQQLIFPVSDQRLNWLSHPIVADLLYGELIVWLLNERRCLGNNASLMETLCPGSTHGLPQDTVVRFTHRLDDVHRILGWMKPLPKTHVRVGCGPGPVAPAS